MYSVKHIINFCIFNGSDYDYLFGPGMEKKRKTQLGHLLNECFKITNILFDLEKPSYDSVLFNPSTSPREAY